MNSVKDRNFDLAGIKFESRSKPGFVSGHFSSSVMAAFASFIISLFAAVGHLLL